MAGATPPNPEGHLAAAAALGASLTKNQKKKLKKKLKKGAGAPADGGGGGSADDVPEQAPDGGSSGPEGASDESCRTGLVHHPVLTCKERRALCQGYKAVPQRMP